MDGRETVGNSLGRAPVGRSDMEATREWEPLGNSMWGELRCEGAIWWGTRGK